MIYDAQVTQEHIDKGWPCSGKDCPVALAIKEAIGTDKVSIGASFGIINGAKYAIAQRVQRWTGLYDCCEGFGPVSPILIHVDTERKLIY